MDVWQLHYPMGSPIGFCQVAVRSFFAQHFHRKGDLDTPKNPKKITQIPRNLPDIPRLIDESFSPRPREAAPDGRGAEILVSVLSRLLKLAVPHDPIARFSRLFISDNARRVVPSASLIAPSTDLRNYFLFAS